MSVFSCLAWLGAFDFVTGLLHFCHKFTFVTFLSQLFSDAHFDIVLNQTSGGAGSGAMRKPRKKGKTKKDTASGKKKRKLEESFDETEEEELSESQEMSAAY